MKSSKQIKQIAIQTIIDEAEAVLTLKDRIDDDFVKCIKLIYNSTGRVIITGIGKSANISTKIVSTLNSTGTRAIFMHAADAIHGDLGMINNDDVIICVSKSGNTPEIKVLVQLIKTLGNKLIGIVGNIDSYLAMHADYIMNASVVKEACPNNLVPTSSTTAQLVMGDALAVALLEYRGFLVSDFAKFHPGGALGKQLYLRVSDLYRNNQVPQVDYNENIRKVIIEISSKRLGATAVMSDGQLMGIITDGDLRRMLEKNISLEKVKAHEVMSKSPKTIDQQTLVSDALGIMRKSNITQLLVLDNSKYVGIIHLHDILREGII